MLFKLCVHTVGCDACNATQESESMPDGPNLLSPWPQAYKARIFATELYPQVHSVNYFWFVFTFETKASHFMVRL